MILTKIKLVGFKSFVDATPILFPSRLVGIVGPNGCGKSNVIDAVRWVMGESAASRLRGEQGTDVIFNGSGGRQPLGQASVELIFDNSDASLGGEYAQYAEISIRRLVSRNGVSHYFLNGTRCRRRDIADIFLGTGLGPRSYAIIQQGMISRLVEAKPEELRLLLEEAAGISKYKERRKETEARMRGARENLERLQDLRLELEKQLSSLKRQAASAEKFKELKHEQRETKAHLFAIKSKALDEKIALNQEKMLSQETALAAIVADIRHCEAMIEQIRMTHEELIEIHEACQSNYYRNNNELAKLEQEIKHRNERKQQLSRDFEQAEYQWASLSLTIEKDSIHRDELKQLLVQLGPEFDLANTKSQLAQENLDRVESELTHFQAYWQEFREKISISSKSAEVEQAHIQQYEQRILTIQNKMQKLEFSLTDMHLFNYENTIALLNEEVEGQRELVEETHGLLLNNKEKIKNIQEKIQEASLVLDKMKQQKQQYEGKRISLEVLQSSALKSHDKKTEQWLSEQGLLNKKRLAQSMQVESGWEHAVETVLGDFLQSICIDKESTHDCAKALAKFKDSSVAMLSHSLVTLSKAKKLAEKIHSDYMPNILYEVWAVETLEEAFAIQINLKNNESVITKEGLWLGPNWVRVIYHHNASQGVLEREKELNLLILQIEELEHSLENQHDLHDELKTQLQSQQSLTEELQQRYQVLSSRLSQKEADLSVQERLLNQSITRREAINQEINENQIEIQQLKEKLAHSRLIWSEALHALSQFESEQGQLEKEKEEKSVALKEVRYHFQQAKQALNDITMKKNVTEVELKSIEKNIDQLQSQLISLQARKEELTAALSESEDPLVLLEEKKILLLDDCLKSEEDLNQSREKVNRVETEQRDLEKKWREAEQASSSMQLQIQTVRSEVEGLVLRKQTLLEQLQEIGQELEQVLQNIKEEKTMLQLEEQLEQIDRRIDRLGPINLVAIDECKEKEERKQYLEAQNADLEQALSALEEAIQKIDKETRTKFKETFEIVNTYFMELFPKVFGGGRASLALTESDVLNAGVEMIAQPPGKKNSSIHLLSGGEKTMVAIALVFSIFQLNPAPFCMLDEVDAPLDDANVIRFSELVREMSQKVQFIVITHNKVTMEKMHQLMGVTMNEPGVSRIVSVDIKEATAFAQ